MIQSDKPILSAELNLLNDKYLPPLVVCQDRIIILLSKDKRLIFYDINRRKLIAECKINDVHVYYVVGDYITIGVYQSQSLLF